MSAAHPDHQLEAELRAMLQRRAEDIDPRPPAWRELAQRNGAIVISLRTGAVLDREAATRRRRPGRQWFRGVVAAAVTLIVAMAAALLVQGSRPGGDTADGPEPLDVPSAGQSDFDAATATPLFPVTDDASSDIAVYDYLSDATETAQQYLSIVLPIRTGRIVVDPAKPQPSVTSDGATPIKTATVAWSFRAEGLPDNPPLAEGTVWLRNPERGARDTWLVVGAATRMLWLDDIRRDGDTLTFTVDRSTDDETFDEPAEVTVNGVEVGGGVRIGEVEHLTVLHPAGSVAIIQVRQIEDGIPVAVTATAVPAVAGAPRELPDRVPVPTTPGSKDTTVVEPAAGTSGAIVVVPAEPVPVVPVADGGG